MKKNTFILMAMTAMFGLTSCDKELLTVENTDKTFTLFATTETGTKTALSGNDTDGYQVVWSEGDQFTVFSFTTPDNKCVFTLKDGDAGKTSGTFMGENLDPSKKYIAYYPVNENFKDILTTWPTNQTYHGENNITGCPMISSTFRGSDKSVTFTNLGGILRLTVKNSENVSIKKITVCADQLESPITLDCSNGGSGVPLTAVGVEFNIAMPSNGNEPASYSNVSIDLTDMEGNICCKSLKSDVKLDIVRSKITKASFSVNSKDFYSCTTGSKVKISGHEGIVVEIDGKKVIVATMNVGATAVNGKGCLGSYMTHDAACKAWSGWRLPDVDELTTLCDVSYPTWGSTDAGEPGDGSNSILAWYIDDVDGIDLYLPLNDYDYGYEGQNPYDKYWTRTGSGDTYYYYAPELIYDSGEGGFTYSPVSYEFRNGDDAPLYKEAVDKTTNEFLVRLFHDLP